jgi:hypothetical protein
VITWLASYPRSGNTLLRTILKHSFGQVSQSIYSDQEFVHPAISEIVGQEAIGQNPFEFVDQAKRQNKHLYVKTHEMPASIGQRAIYVVRDGRSCMVSCLHYGKDVLGKTISLDDVIRGRAGWPSWSQHVGAWALSGRPYTLVVRYEDLAAGCLQTLKAISGFIGLPILRNFDISFDQLHALDPTFFRCGSDSTNLGRLDPAAASLFERLHGDTLRRIGYHCGPPRRLSKETGHAGQHFETQN